MGLGRQSQEEALVAAETASRRQLTVEAQLQEDEEQRQGRILREEEKARTRAHVQEMQRAFYCEVCSSVSGVYVCSIGHWTHP
jgi:hypothetical protein